MVRSAFTVFLLGVVLAGAGAGCSKKGPDRGPGTAPIWSGSAAMGGGETIAVPGGLTATAATPLEPGRSTDPDAADPGPGRPGAPAHGPTGMPAGSPVPVASSGDASFAISIKAPSGAAGAEVEATVTVKPGAGYHVNVDYPSKLTVEPSAGVTVADAQLDKGKAAKLDETELTFAVKLTASAAGTYEVPATLKFAVCTASTCDPKKQSITIKLAAN